jgi:integrating conjugative element protein (TIGR03749 family)
MCMSFKRMLSLVVWMGLSVYAARLQAEDTLNLPSQLALTKTQMQQLKRLLPMQGEVNVAAAKTPTIAQPVSTKPTIAAYSTESPKISLIALTRFAVQQLYAPKRLLVTPPSIYRVPMHAYKSVDLVRDGSLMAMPLASWQGGDHVITAVLLRNQLPNPLTVRPQQLCGHWQTATIFPQATLGPRGEVTDSTTVFLVSHRSFAESLS